MPLVIMCGFPSSGKTKRSKELKESLFKHRSAVDVVVVDDGNICRNKVYQDRKCEITVRGSLKSTVERHLSNNNIVIVDSLNYVKGFRYELHCVAKYARSSHCVIHCDASIADIVAFNQKKEEEERYSDEILQALVDRFEAPNSMARWDSPLFTVQVTDDLPVKEIFSALFESKKPKPNMSTQNPPLMSPTFMYETDQLLQVLGARILSEQKTAQIGDTITFPNTSETYTIKHKLNVSDMRKQRKQFLTYLRANPVQDISQIPRTFLSFLGSEH